MGLGRVDGKWKYTKLGGSIKTISNQDIKAGFFLKQRNQIRFFDSVVYHILFHIMQNSQKSYTWNTFNCFKGNATQRRELIFYKTICQYIYDPSKNVFSFLFIPVNKRKHSEYQKTHLDISVEKLVLLFGLLHVVLRSLTIKGHLENKGERLTKG